MRAGELTGKSRTHIVEVFDPKCSLHIHAVVPFMNLRRHAATAGFDLRPESSFRDFSRQLDIWNGKFKGDRPVYDAVGQPLDITGMSPDQRVSTILLWSALPGASRHHWGTDLDVIDAAAVPPGYRVRLTLDEFEADGPFAPLARWLDDHAGRFGFFRPFRGVLSGVQPEPWHLSFAPVAEMARRALRADVLRSALCDAPLLGKTEVLSRLEELHARYVAAIDWP